MICMAIVLAFYLATTDLHPGLFGWKRIVLITILFLYATMRAWRLRNMLRKDKHVEDEEPIS